MLTKNEFVENIQNFLVAISYVSTRKYLFGRIGFSPLGKES